MFYGYYDQVQSWEKLNALFFILSGIQLRKTLFFENNRRCHAKKRGNEG